MEKVKLFLTGAGNRYWKIQELYSNGTKVALTTAQLQYNKTYTTFSTNPENTGTFADSDGYKGSWILNDVNHMTETIENNPTGPVKTVLTIKEIGQYKMDVEYMANGQTTRTVYTAN